MRILNRRQFLALPQGILYAKYEPCVFEQLAIKEESLPDDWFLHHLMEIEAKNSGEWIKLVVEAEKTGKSLVLDYDTEERDGCFERDQLFAVFEKNDVAHLIKKFETIHAAYPADLTPDAAGK